jgi:hypothetical protein
MPRKILLFIAVVVALITPVLVLADNFGVGDAARGTLLIGSNTSVNATQTLPVLIGKIVALVLSFVGIIFFLLVLFAGLRWMTAFGNSEKVDQAKSIMEHAAIGLVIVLAAYAISIFVFSRLTRLGSSDSNNPAANNTSANMGCCSNYETGNRIQTLQENCSGSTRTWVAGSCPTTGLGCCSNAATGNSVATFQEACSGPTRMWLAGPCP